MQQSAEFNKPVDWDGVRRTLAEVLAEAEDCAAELALEMRMEAQRLSKEEIRAGE